MRKSSFSQLKLFRASINNKLSIIYTQNSIQAGFPSPADDFMDLSIDLNEELIQHPSATFYARVRGDSMIEDGIGDGDLLVVDRSLEVQDGKIAICCLNGEFTVKRFKKAHDHCWLLPANKAYKPIRVSREDDFMVWGIVVHVIKSL